MMIAFLAFGMAITTSVYPTQITQSSTVAPSESASQLTSDFDKSTVFWKQFEIAKKIVSLHDAAVLTELESHLTDEDRHLRGNAGFVFAALGDDRGFEVIKAILNDRSDRPPAQGIGFGNANAHEQIKADRYYATWLFGQLKDPRSVPILIPLLNDTDVKATVPWALGEIGDKTAIPPLIDMLSDASPDMRVLAIYALQRLDAKQALPQLRLLLKDNSRISFGSLSSVADAARAAVVQFNGFRDYDDFTDSFHEGSK